MKIRLSSELIKKIPGIDVGVIVLKNINNLRKSSMVAQLLRGACASRKRELQNAKFKDKVEALLQPTLSEGTILAETQQLESLLKKINKAAELKNENNLTDLIHHLTLKYLTPVAGRDLDNTEKDIEIDFLKAGKSKKVESKIFTPESQNIVIWLFNIGNFSKEDFQKLPAEFAKTIQKYCGGYEADLHLLNADEPEADLQYVSDKEEEYRQFLLLNPTHEAERAAKAACRFYSKEASAPSELTASEVANTEAPNSKFQIPNKSQTDSKFQISNSESQNELLLKDQLKEELNKVIAAMNFEMPVKVVNKPVSDESTTQTTTHEPTLQKMPEVEIETPREKNHGDYSANIGMKLGKMLNKNPREVAEEIIKNFPTLPYISKTEIAGPGFINFHLSTNYLQKELRNIIESKENYGKISFGKSQKVLVEYSQPNIAKPLGVHHLLSTLLGQILANILQFGGYEVVRLNYLGDWGTQFGKLIYALNTWGNREEVEKDPINELLKLYVRFHEEAEKEPTLEDKGRAEFKKLEDGDQTNRQLWHWIRDISIKDLERLYEKLGVHFDEWLGESMYEEGMKEILELGKSQGIFVVGEKGALIVQFENDQYPPYLIQKADGSTLYSTRDLASIKDRLTRYHPAKILYIVDVAQSLHFKQLFATAQKLKLEGAELEHIVFGRMQFPEGRMSTRKGTVIKLDELIKEAEERTTKIVEEKSADLPPAEKKKISEGLALGAIKYQIVSQNRESNMTFDWDRMLALDGNSAPYLQYTYARAQSILRKAKEQPFVEPLVHAATGSQTNIFDLANEGKSEIDAQFQAAANLKPFEHAREQELMRALAKFPEHIEQTVQTYKPNLLTNYLYELAQLFNTFYQEAPVLSAASKELRESRLQIVQGFTQVMKNGLKLLGIEVFERM